METIHSKDGTSIAFDRTGHGPTLILVGGMFEQRALDTETARLAALPALAEHFTIVHYDRRGRGDSANTLPFAVEREIEDVKTLIDHVGETAYVFGISSGAALAFEAALKLGGKVRKLALYEPPYNDDPDARHAWVTFSRELDETLARGQHAEAVGLFMKLLGVPAEHIAGMRAYPMWPMWEAVAPTMAYDVAALGAEAAVPAKRAAGLAIPTLVMSGSESYPFMSTSAATLASALPRGRHQVLDGQTHEVDVNVLAPILIEFFNES